LRLDLKKNIEFTFGDPEWIAKMLKLSASYLFVVTIPSVLGYQLNVIREAADGEDERLPEFGSNFGSLWVKGVVFSVLISVLMMVPMFALGAIGFGTVMAAGQASEGLAIGLGIVMAIAFFLVLLMLGILVPALMLRYAMTGNTASLFDVRSAMSDIKQGPSDYAVIVLVPLAGQFLVSLVGATGLGLLLVIPLTVLVMIVQARMLGNYYRAYFH